jgi:acetylglutamate kinase
MDVDQALYYIKSGIISNGMIPKVKCCIDAIQNGVNKVHIIDGRIEHSLLLEIFTPSGIGTMFNKIN